MDRSEWCGNSPPSDLRSAQVSRCARERWTRRRSARSLPSWTSSELLVPAVVWVAPGAGRSALETATTPDWPACSWCHLQYMRVLHVALSWDCAEWIGASLSPNPATSRDQIATAVIMIIKICTRSLSVKIGYIHVHAFFNRRLPLCKLGNIAWSPDNVSK